MCIKAFVQFKLNVGQLLLVKCKSEGTYVVASAVGTS